MSDSTISNLTAQTTLHDADLGVGVDTTDTTQSANGTTKKFTWTTIKSFLKTYFDTLYPTATLDTDGTLSANSDTKIASQKAVKTYVDTSDWKTISATLTYSSADSPTFIASTSADLTGSISVGMKIQLTQTTAKYFFVTAITSSTITLYGGTDYTLANATITSPKYSTVKAPFGFPINPSKWTVSLIDSTDVAQATPTTGVWYNLGSLSLSIPIGCWNLKYRAHSRIERSNSTNSSHIFTSLSTSNNSNSDGEFTTSLQIAVGASTLTFVDEASLGYEKIVALSSKTTYYLVASTDAGSAIKFLGTQTPTVIKYTCAYL